MNDIQTEIEKKLGIAVVNPAYPPGHVRRYGAVGDEKAIDDAQAVNRAMTPVLTKQYLIPFLRSLAQRERNEGRELNAVRLEEAADEIERLQAEPPARPAMSVCGSCGLSYDMNQGHHCPEFYAK